MLKLERISDQLGTRIRMSGQLRSDELGQAMAEVKCDPHRTAEGGWGVAGTAFGQQEFKALAEKARAKSLREER